MYILSRSHDLFSTSHWSIDFSISPVQLVLSDFVCASRRLTQSLPDRFFVFVVESNFRHTRPNMATVLYQKRVNEFSTVFHINRLYYPSPEKIRQEGKVNASEFVSVAVYIFIVSNTYTSVKDSPLVRCVFFVPD